MKNYGAPSLILLMALIGWHCTSLSITMLTKNDPYPLYTTAYPYHYLLFGITNYLKGITDEPVLDRFSFTISPFHQKANIGRDFDGCRSFLGDLEGKWYMLGLLYGSLPTGCSFTTTVGDGCVNQLGRAKEIIFDIPANDMVPCDRVLTDTTGNIGYFSVPLKYRKSGVRFEFNCQPFEDFGFTIQWGLADIKQTLTNFIDLTQTVSFDNAFFPELVIQQVESLLMSSTQADEIFRQIGLETCDFEEDSVEDIRYFLWWRHPFEICNYK